MFEVDAVEAILSRTDATDGVAVVAGYHQLLRICDLWKASRSGLEYQNELKCRERVRRSSTQVAGTATGSSTNAKAAPRIT